MQPITLGLAIVAKQCFSRREVGWMENRKHLFAVEDVDPLTTYVDRLDTGPNRLQKVMYKS